MEHQANYGCYGTQRCVSILWLSLCIQVQNEGKYSSKHKVHCWGHIRSRGAPSRAPSITGLVSAGQLPSLSHSSHSQGLTHNDKICLEILESYIRARQGCCSSKQATADMSLQTVMGTLKWVQLRGTGVLVAHPILRMIFSQHAVTARAIWLILIWECK